MLMSGIEDFVGSSVLTYLKSKSVELQSFPWQTMVHQSVQHLHDVMIFNIVSHEQSCADFVSYLNNNRFKIYGNTVVVIADSSLAQLCIELLYIDKAIILTDKSELYEFGRLTTLTSVHWNPRSFRSQKKLTVREQQILSLLVSGYSPKKISELIDLNYKTIQAHKIKIIVKLGLSNSTELNKLIVRFNHHISFLP
ncbi:TPA: LuxR C-terminal-related transcriptional regulator [Citrobacter braakii]